MSEQTRIWLVWLLIAIVFGTFTWWQGSGFLLGFIIAPVAIILNGWIAERVDDW